MKLTDDVKFVSGVGEKVAALLGKQEIFTVEDLINNIPRRYNDYSLIQTVAEAEAGPITVRVKIEDVAGRYVKRGLHITEASVYDDTDRMRVVWFNQPYRKNHLKENTEYFMSGELGFSANRYQLTNPATELVSSFQKNTARIVPIYRESKGLTSHLMRKFIFNVLPLVKQLPETLPPDVIKQNSLISRAEAIEQMHFPSSTESLEQAKKRIGFEEVFEITFASLLAKFENSKDKGVKIPFDEDLAKKFVKSLEFKLTDSQRKSAFKILKDISRGHPMNRLLEGDVGSGKTIVAAMAILMALDAGYQVAYMAPTEILAKQHQATFTSLLKDFGYKPELLIGSLKAAVKKRINEKLKAGSQRLVIGTHALIQKDVNFKKIGLIVVDEQHRFGVDQRKELQKKAGYMPHVLSMTATPIPRTLALILYGELDISILSELPPGRRPVITEIASPNSRTQLYKQIDDQIELGKQVFVICPLISESDKLGVRSVEEEYKKLNTGVFKHRKIALLHGKLKTEEKEKIMQDFRDSKYDIMVSTTVVEVGVDIPNANVMLIEGAERFGLAQLHQLRGRVGRSNDQAYCFIVPTSSSRPSKRLRAFVGSTNGFKLAEVDLQIRGPGEIYGARQHGALDLRVAKLSDHKLINSARSAANQCIENGLNLLHYPRLAKRVNELRAITNLN